MPGVVGEKKNLTEKNDYIPSMFIVKKTRRDR